MSSRAGQIHPKGTAFAVDDAWRDEVKKILVERNISPARLARSVGATDAAISNLLKGKSNSSRYLPQIHAFLKMPMPVASTIDEHKQILDTIWKHLNKNDKEIIAKLAESLKSR